jgi:hypothetical protein
LTLAVLAHGQNNMVSSIRFTVSAETTTGYVYEKTETAAGALVWLQKLKVGGGTDIRVFDVENRRYVTEQELKDLVNASRPQR